jgi:DNA-binding GntR family transcriptional regulator
MPKPISTQPGATTLVTRVYQQLRREIVTGALQPGEKLRVEALGDRYGVGASPLREALNRLSAEGLVLQQDQRGFQVARISIEELLELTRARRWINEIALRESIGSGGAEWEERVLLAYHRLTRRPVKSGDAASEDAVWDQLHQRFHTALISACPSRHVIEFANRLFDEADRYRNLVVVQSTTERDIAGEHRQIMEAAMARRTDECIALLNEHIQQTTNLILEHLERAGATGAMPTAAPAAVSS